MFTGKDVSSKMYLEGEECKVTAMFYNQETITRTVWGPKGVDL